MSRDAVIIPFLLTCLLLRLIYYFSEPKTYQNGDRIRLTAKVRSEPIRFENSQYLKLKGLKIYLPLYPEISYGDRVIVEGVVKDDKITNPELVSMKSTDNYLFTFRKRLIEFYRKSLPEPHSSLIAGVTIGSKSGIPPDFWQSLKNSGTAHVVVASGMNVTLVAGFLINFFTLIWKRKKALVAALAGIWLYALLSGFDSPVVRAAIMGSLAFTAQEFGRLNLSIRALVFSAFLMLLINPGYIFDIGFWLSFCATLTIILFQKVISKLFRFVPQFLRQDFSTSIAAQIGVAPILFLYFGQFNILSPVVNLLILWSIVPITLLGILGGITGLIVPLIGRMILLLTFPLTFWFVKVVELFG